MESSTINGAAALACVGGTLGSLVATAAVIELRRRWLLRGARRRRAPFHGDYSTPEAAELDRALTKVERYAEGLSFQVIMLLLATGLTAVLYAGLWYELIGFWLGAAPPTIEPVIFSFFVLVDGSVILGASISAFTERPRKP